MMDKETIEREINDGARQQRVKQVNQFYFKALFGMHIALFVASLFERSKIGVSILFLLAGIIYIVSIALMSSDDVKLAYLEGANKAMRSKWKLR